MVGQTITMRSGHRYISAMPTISHRVPPIKGSNPQDSGNPRPLGRGGGQTNEVIRFRQMNPKPQKVTKPIVFKYIRKSSLSI